MTAASSPIQLSECPWCGTQISIRRRTSTTRTSGATLLFCGDAVGACPFTERKQPGRGHPGAHRRRRDLPPAARPARRDTSTSSRSFRGSGPVHMLFGRVDRRCTRHGYRSPDLDKSGDSRSATGTTRGTGSRRRETVSRHAAPAARPVIQDELHLIAGPLGTMVGLYETAIDELSSLGCRREAGAPEGHRVDGDDPPGEHQAQALFARQLEVFPPPGAGRRATRSSPRETPSARQPGRLYLGVCAPGERLKSVEVRVFVDAPRRRADAVRAARRGGRSVDDARRLLQRDCASSAGMRRLVEDDVSTRLRRADRRGLARRYRLELDELTSSRRRRRSQAQARPCSRRTHVPDPPKGQRRGRSTSCSRRT